eukprot:97941_1
MNYSGKHSIRNFLLITTIYAKKKQSNPLRIYALYCIFINDLNMITGPHVESEYEMMINEKYDMTEKNGYHNLFAWRKSLYNIEFYDSIYKRNDIDYGDVMNDLWSSNAINVLNCALRDTSISSKL